jgi:tetratricopeptide (TPR) repeat protein
MKLFRISCLLSCALCVPMSPAYAADDLAISQRTDEALMWQRKSRDDLAADIWRRILVLDPNHALALLNLGLIEARAGHPAEARALLLRAQRLKKPPMGLARLEAALADQPEGLPAPELAEPVVEARSTSPAASSSAEARRSERRSKRRAESAAVASAEADRASGSTPRSERTAPNTASRSATVLPGAASTVAERSTASSSSAAAQDNSAALRFAAPTASAKTTVDAAAFSAPSASSGVSTSSARSSGERSSADERSPAIPFPELASQLPMGTSLARPTVVPLEATSTGTVVRGKPRPTKPLPFLPPPV